MKHVAAAVATVLVGLIVVGQGLAETSAQVRTLARQAEAGDSGALSRLRAIDEVDGRSVALGRALAGATGADLTERLRTLAGDVEVAPDATPAGPASAEAAEILSERRFQETTGVHPFRNALRWAGDWLRRLVGGPYGWLAAHFPGGELGLDVVLGALVVAAAAFVAWLVSSRRGGVRVDRRLRDLRAGEPGRDPAALEQRADEAERQGELELALRLRFRAGLLRLERAGAIPRGQRTSRELRGALGLVEFDRVSRGFDEVVYGRRPPSSIDVRSARADWRVILDQARAA